MLVYYNTFLGCQQEKNFFSEKNQLYACIGKIKIKSFNQNWQYISPVAPGFIDRRCGLYDYFFEV